MDDIHTNPKSTASIAGHPIHPMLIPFPVAFLVSALVTDIAYARTYNALWATASGWLLLAGVVMALVAAVFGFIDFFGSRQVRRLRPAWMHMIGNLVAVVLSVVNLLVHFGDAAGGILPVGITLSAIVVLLLLFNGWMGWEMVYKHKVGIAE